MLRLWPSGDKNLDKPGLELRKGGTLLEFQLVEKIGAALAAGLGFDLPVPENIVAQQELVAAGKQRPAVTDVEFRGNILAHGEHRLGDSGLLHRRYGAGRGYLERFVPHGAIVSSDTLLDRHRTQA